MDLSQIKNRLTSLQTKKTKGEKIDYTKYFWKPSVGKQTIRIVPSAFDKQNPFKEVFFHYGIGNKKVMIALTNFGEKDPIVELSKELRKSSEPEQWQLAKKLSPKMRVFVPVVVRGEEEAGVKLWEFGKEMYMDLLNLADDEDIGDYTSVTNGRDLKVTTVGPDVTGTSYNKSSVTARPTQSPITTDKALLEKLLSEQPDVLTLYKKYTFDEMKQTLQEWLYPSEKEEDKEEKAKDEDDESPFEEPAKPAFSLKNKAPKKSKEDEFDDLFKDGDED
jgi:hypothetical protein